MRTRTILLIALLALILPLVACGGDEEGIPENAAFKITGQVDKEVGWTEEAIRDMDTRESESTNSQGESETYTGVSVNKLLEKAKPQSGATTLVLIADDGYSAEIPLDEVQACDGCILAFRSKGGFTSRMPGFPKNTAVKGIIEINVK